MSALRLWSTLCVAGFALLAASPAFADARIEAKRRFQNGMQLIASGKYDEGIAELLEAYQIKPHPNVLYNVGRAYHDAGRVPEAIEFYKRYLATRPPDAGSLQATVARLEASVVAPPAPEPAPQQQRAEALPMPPPPRGTTQLSAATEAQVKQLTALVERLEQALAKSEAQQAAQQASASTPTPGAPALDSGISAAEVESGAVPYEELVVTASRRAQSSFEAPNATTVITAEEIRLSGATSIVELLRRVPGAEVMALGVGSSNVSFRGFNQRLANKVLVLIDGRTEYQDFLGLTLWSSMPVGLEEIERIEVIRGPGSALYGANAVLGVINIITRRPGSGPQAELNGIAGTGNTYGGSFVSSGGAGELRYRASAAYFQQDKWSKDYDEGRPDVAPMIADPNLGLQSARGNLTTTYAFSRDVELGLSGGVNAFYSEMYPLGLLRNFFLDGHTAYGKADLEAGAWKLKFFWNHLTSDAGPQYSPVGQEAMQTHVASNVFNGEILFGEQFDLLGRHSLNVGLEGRLKRVAWDYLESLRNEVHAAAFIQDEWRPWDPLRIMASFRIDRHPLLDEGQPGFALSPRVSAVWIPIAGHALRASWASAFREPTMLESYVAIRIPIPGVNGASALTRGSTDLRPERLTAYEVGYRGENIRLGLEWDLALYQHEVSDLIGLSALSRVPSTESFDPLTNTYLLGVSRFQNEPSTYLARGVELGAKVSPVDRVDLRFSGAFQRVTSSNAEGVCGPCSQAPELKLFGGVTYRSRANLDVSFQGGYTSATTWIEREPAPSDPTQIEPLANPLPGYAVFDARVAYHLIPGKAQLAINGTHLAGSHAQHPFGNRIERRFFTTLTVTP